MSAAEGGQDENGVRSGSTTLVVTVTNEPGSLSDVLEAIKDQNLNMTRIQSKPSTQPDCYDIELDVSDTFAAENLEALRAELLAEKEGGTAAPAVEISVLGHADVPWFPRTHADLDRFNLKTLAAGAELDSDHPGFNDPEYRERREAIVEIAKTYKWGDEIPRIEYSEAEIDTWRTVYNELVALYPTHACAQFNHVLPLLIQECGYGPDNIPQLEDISRFLKKCTGFTLKPVTGLLSARDFLNALAFRVFHSTQYIRHHSRPLYTPEPDVCHELLGHVPLFADPEFAQFSQEIGMASIGVSDEDITRLATCYWFTVEFGLCRENGALKAYGAGLLSSFGELEYCLSEEPEVAEFVPKTVAETEYPITTFQPKYFAVSSFEDAMEKMRDFSSTFDRPVAVHWNHTTQSIEILDTREKIIALQSQIIASMRDLKTALTLNLKD